MNQKKISSRIILVILVVILVLLIVFGPSIKSSILVGTLIPGRMTYGEIAERMGCEGVRVRLTDAAYYGWYLPNGKFLLCRFVATDPFLSGDAFPDAYTMVRVSIHDEPRKGWVKES